MIETTTLSADVQAQLVDDETVARFVVSGYHVMQPELPAGFHERVAAQLDALERNPGDGILDAVPDLQQIWEHPQVRGFLASLLGHDYAMHSHRHWHCTPPGSAGGQWHQDGRNQTHHQMPTILGFYYPQAVTPANGPTVILPGSHQRNCPTDRMGGRMSYRDQVVLTGAAGTVAFAHYDIWHTASPNRSQAARHMLKFLFKRQSPPAGPSWASTPESRAVAQSVIGGPRVVACSQSDYYKELGLRRLMWSYLQGES